MNKYLSFVSATELEIDYEDRKLREDGYVLKVRCNKTNPECQKYQVDQAAEGHLTKIVELDPAKNGNNMVHIWVKAVNK